jgi:Ni/Fe-hydrogenase subunit HybB-like protein
MSKGYSAACTKEGEESPSMWAFIVAIIVFGLTLVISTLVLFRYGRSDNQTLPPSTAAQKTSTIGTLIAFGIAASHWLAPDFDAVVFPPFLALLLAALLAALSALLRALLRW